MKTALMFNTGRDGYAPDQCGETLTVGELIEILKEYDEDMEVYYRNDNGYTYGYISERRIREEYLEEEDDD